MGSLSVTIVAHCVAIGFGVSVRPNRFASIYILSRRFGAEWVWPRAMQTVVHQALPSSVRPVMCGARLGLALLR